MLTIVSFPLYVLTVYLILGKVVIMQTDLFDSIWNAAFFSFPVG
jgi:hypothetical protein